MHSRSFHSVMTFITFMLMLFGLASGCVSEPVTTDQTSQSVTTNPNPIEEIDTGVSEEETSIETFVNRNWSNEAVQQLNLKFEEQGFSVAKDKAIQLFDQNGAIGVLIPYHTSNSLLEIAITIIEDADGVAASALTISTNNGMVEHATVLYWNEGSLNEETVVLENEEEGVAPPPYHACGGNKWCCFWGCMLGACGGGSMACLATGPGFWACLLGVCGVSTYGCWYSCY